jgi:UrcA family protein
MNTPIIIARARINIRNAFTTALAVAVTSLGLLTASHAADDLAGMEPAKMVVQYGDLNLANPSAVQRLYHRIVVAAQQVCDDHTGPRPLEEGIRARSCMDQSIRRAVAAVNHPSLTALYAAKNGQSPARSVVLANRR